MSYDCYIEKPQGDASTRLRFLVNKEDSTFRYLKLVHGTLDKKQFQRGEYNKLIAESLPLIEAISVRQHDVPKMALLPIGSWFLQFTFTLAKPWISKDDDSFYVAESVNPVRKDKVFKVPFMSASAWKGLLRWTMMHTRLTLKKKDLSDDEFAHERFNQSMLFGDEKGEEPGKRKDFAAYLDDLRKLARKKYLNEVPRYFIFF